MIHKFSRYIMTLALLIAAVGGAWAEEVTIGDPTSTSTNSYLPSYSLYDYSFTQQIYTADEIGMSGTITTLTMWLKNTSSYARNFNVYMKEVSGSIFEANNSWVSLSADDLVGTATINNGVENPTETTFTLETPFEYSGTGNLLICIHDITGTWSSGMGGVCFKTASNQSLYAYRDGTAYDISNPGVNGTLINEKNVVRLDIEESGLEVTTNAAEEGATFTEATFAMPAFDATVDYEIVRDMAISMPVTVGTGNDGYRIRIKKDEQSGKFVPAETDVAGMMALIKVHDAIENEDLTFFNMGGAVDCSVNIYAIDAEDKPVGDPIAFQDLVPGRYIAKAVAATGSTYDGETQQSNIFVLFQGFELEIAAGEYATFYKEEPLYVEDEDAKLYTISSVTDTEAVLSEQIIVAPALTPLLVYNSSDETKTFLLIPSVEEADDVTPAEEFKGTLVAKTFSEDDMAAANHFVLTAAQAFVWVKNAGTIAANRCWLELPISAASNARVIVFGDATGIDGISDISGMSGDWFDLNGRKLQKMPTKKGIYILNGRKVVVK